MFDGSAEGTQIGIQAIDGGIRALVRLATPEAPERYDYAVTGNAAQLRMEDDGSVSVLDGAGVLTSHIATPWARDAAGSEVPTHFELDGLRLTQVVEHHGASYAYPVVADPFWSTAWEVVKCTAAVGAFIAGNLFLVTKVRKLGGIAKAVEKLRGASNYANRYKAAIAIFGEVAGVNSLLKECT